MTQQMIGFGFITANWVGYGSQYIKSNTSWRMPLALQMVPAGLLLIGIQFLPDSPRWLLEVNRDEDARQVVYKIHGSGNKVSADQEFEEMRATIKAEMAVRSSRLSDLWSSPAMLRRTLVAVGVQIMGQFSGINVLNYFGPKMYEGLGITGSKGLLVQGIYGAVGPITNFIFITLALDRIGRKRPLQFGAAAFVVTFSILAAIVASFPPPPEGSGIRETASAAAAHRAGVAMIFLTSIFFSLSFGPVSWVLASEVFPTKTRSIGTSVATCSNWAMNVMISQVSPLGMDNIGWKFYMLFVVLNAIDFSIITAFFPETKGRNLESEMDEVFGDHPHAGSGTPATPETSSEREEREKQ
jgi:sugar porter (SP) family MFS transporter